MTVDGLGRRGFVTWASVLAAGAGTSIVKAQDAPAKPQDAPGGEAQAAPAGPTEAAFERDYEAPKFRPSWKKQQLSRLML
ncbi:MAG: hypothetical protein ACKPJJ_12140, partial [Planctomycetaceae bacterium]